MSRPPCLLLLSCEHGGNRIPARYAAAFAGAARELAGHRGWDLGALALARRLSRLLRAPLVASVTSRLLVDLNRSAHHPRCFSRYTRDLPDAERRRILERHYHPHRGRVEAAAARARADGRTLLHLAVHSFAPVLGGERRRADLGLLYDPAHPGERELCARWRDALLALDPKLRVRRNHPYRGRADGLTTALRARFSRTSYLGVELEVNQRLATAGDAARSRLAQTLAASLAPLLVGRAAPR